ncbi:DUF2599 domain-containing protein [Pseudomonas sp. SWRI102]|uniref:DUF2599 domain-containing protein n=1 Tax=Pseudomonas marvdashtae TaxID=2745500 RepID=A0A923FMC6_9PSED|nr:DUF2599 domain-containing protein [Pseudomonas marvdashtae]MBV4552358.1 DUF2599 domain-containing protein [Pseudomonas marvdashtae]
MNTSLHYSSHSTTRACPPLLLSIGLILHMGSTSAEQIPQAAPRPADSFIQTVERCDKYIESAQWMYRDFEWSFSITPTTCARRTPPEGTAYLWDELTRDYSNNRLWTNTHGLRHQLICHVVTARDKPQWNLEPWRPDVGYSLTVAAGCNHGTPLPEVAP